MYFLVVSIYVLCQSDMCLDSGSVTVVLVGALVVRHRFFLALHS